MDDKVKKILTKLIVYGISKCRFNNNLIKGWRRIDGLTDAVGNVVILYTGTVDVTKESSALAVVLNKDVTEVFFSFLLFIFLLITIINDING